MEIPNYPQVNSKNFIKWNDEMFLKYNNERVYKHPNLLIRYIEQKRVQKILDFLAPIKKTDYILAAGCGEGYIEKKLSKAQLLLVDISKYAISRAKKTLGHKKRIKYLRANLEKLPLKSKTFNKIECSEVIEHVYNPTKLLKELNRVAKDDGVLVISFPNEPLINNLKKILLKLRLFNLFFPNIPTNMLEEWHLRSMDLDTFRKLSKKYWKIISLSPVPSPLLPIRYVVKCAKRP